MRAIIGADDTHVVRYVTLYSFGSQLMARWETRNGLNGEMIEEKVLEAAKALILAEQYAQWGYSVSWYDR